MIDRFFGHFDGKLLTTIVRQVSRYEAEVQNRLNINATKSVIHVFLIGKLSEVD
jgi:hypothetical protein